MRCVPFASRPSRWCTGSSGGGEEGEKHTVQTKEEADHTLQYMIAVALIDGQVQPAQYAAHITASSSAANVGRATGWPPLVG